MVLSVGKSVVKVALRHVNLPLQQSSGGGVQLGVQRDQAIICDRLEMMQWPEHHPNPE